MFFLNSIKDLSCFEELFKWFNFFNICLTDEPLQSKMDGMDGKSYHCRFYSTPSSFPQPQSNVHPGANHGRALLQLFMARVSARGCVPMYMHGRLIAHHISCHGVNVTSVARNDERNHVVGSSSHFHLNVCPIARSPNVHVSHVEGQRTSTDMMLPGVCVLHSLTFWKISQCLLSFVPRDH